MSATDSKPSEDAVAASREQPDAPSDAEDAAALHDRPDAQSEFFIQARAQLRGKARRRPGAERPGRYLGQFRPEFSRLHLEADTLWVLPLRSRYVLSIVGRAFSGRSDAQRYLAANKGFRVYTLGEALARHLALPVSSMPEGRPLRRYAADLRDECGDPAVIARWALREIRREHLARTERWLPAERIAITGFGHPAELALVSKLTRSAVIRIALDPDARCERAIESGLLTREHGIKHPNRLTTKRFCAVVDDAASDGLPHFVEDMDGLMGMDLPAHCHAREIVVTKPQYDSRGLERVLTCLDKFVPALDGNFPIGDF